MLLREEEEAYGFPLKRRNLNVARGMGVATGVVSQLGRGVALTED